MDRLAVDVEILMDEAETDPDIDFIVTFGHRGAYTSGTHLGSIALRDVLGALGATYPKYVLNINGHGHNYERTFAQNGVVHVTVGAGGARVGADDPNCPWLVCPPPSWSAFRAVRNGALKLNLTGAAGGKAGIDGSFIRGPASDRNDVNCTVGEVIGSFSIGPNLPPDSVIDPPFGDPAIIARANAVITATPDRPLPD
jgi:hypothetical protein